MENKGKKYSSDNCPPGLCRDDSRGWGGCLDDSLRDKQEVVERLDTLGREKLIKESKAVSDRTLNLIRAALLYEMNAENQLGGLGDYMSEEELKIELLHMYERNQDALEIMEATGGAQRYADKLVTEVATGRREKYRD